MRCWTVGISLYFKYCKETETNTIETSGGKRYDGDVEFLKICNLPPRCQPQEIVPHIWYQFVVEQIAKRDLKEMF